MIVTHHGPGSEQNKRKVPVARELVRRIVMDHVVSEDAPTTRFDPATCPDSQNDGASSLTLDTPRDDDSRL